MKLGLHDTFVLDVPLRDVWSVYYICLEVPRSTDCQNVGLLQRHCQEIKIITYVKGMRSREGLLPICKRDTVIFQV